MYGTREIEWGRTCTGVQRVMGGPSNAGRQMHVVHFARKGKKERERERERGRGIQNRIA
jgi:hypothetical protein